MPGALVISLDFELHWGVRDIMSVEQYRDNLLGERVAVTELLNVFRQRDLHATWATVGFLFCANKRELRDAMPRCLPHYADAALSPYTNLDELGEDERSDPFHYAPSLVEKIVATPGQELATHTFSHFYCLEAGQTAADFDADLEAAQQVGRRFGDITASLVFPRNQFNPSYKPVMQRRGVRTYRSNGKHWAYAPAISREPALKRAVRLGDAYLPLAGPRTAAIAGPDEHGLVDVPASAFLRPYSPRLRRLEELRFRRLERALVHAARNGHVFHLWWHPHNFGTNLRENLRMLERILDRFDQLKHSFDMKSWTMLEARDAAVAAA